MIIFCFSVMISSARMKWVRHLILEILIIQSTSATGQLRYTAGWLSEPSTRLTLALNSNNHPVDLENVNRHVDPSGKHFLNVSPIARGHEKSSQATGEVSAINHHYFPQVSNQWRASKESSPGAERVNTRTAAADG
ncbi:hypothetical protein PGTUg99_025495 [Puccinia graminis f. sp. tritici]|uniref:Uncharacterized protein n=1 Tax=Puccinia graminis f. sp. tritici TaxID=56615 RepID=A0A5B0P595_PUCGR|nr:hypothetical protein PGTUg99_025495 [Puccinia graminis f. sp. tritici]